MIDMIKQTIHCDAKGCEATEAYAAQPFELPKGWIKIYHMDHGKVPSQQVGIYQTGTHCCSAKCALTFIAPAIQTGCWSVAINMTV